MNCCELLFYSSNIAAGEGQKNGRVRRKMKELREPKDSPLATAITIPDISLDASLITPAVVGSPLRLRSPLNLAAPLLYLRSLASSISA